MNAETIRTNNLTPAKKGRALAKSKTVIIPNQLKSSKRNKNKLKPAASL